ncbi:permease for cytosine/purine, uracil, thiamine, allantoin family protein [Mycolicibacterium hassiacum DSM 44199]|uniref:Permease for cytosine/purine, uracil, thiamine, allantoin family protein n=1 Tax=Mycolicibacterium hassiacum (strain DSM 44199 / CIP 105218 / JCM 12690 / 3849) TaxID=1122247 RepID=K5BD72_MYCHD|nr:permease for cytosine/purine, uracil, thiamine, allantoin family protein [Mycolicibacterium hassiacum DSM 44199]MDA4088070.1 permease for cytosine/purine uracil thiamine allantoin family protein [Mycolicibacterium hassiacum DSM 44199]
MSMAWCGLMSAMFWVVVGSTVTLTVGTIDTIIGIALSALVYGALNQAAARYANRTGTSVSLFSRALFGRAGSAFAAALFGITITYYVVAEGAIVASALHAYFPAVPAGICALIVVAYQAPLAMRGVTTWLDKINGILLPLYLVGLVGSVIWTIARYGYSNDWLTYEPAGAAQLPVPGWWFAFTVYMGVWVVTMMAWDFARFGRPEDAEFNSHVTFGTPYYIMTLLVNGVVGMFLAHTIEIDGPLSEESAILGIVTLMGFWGLLWVVISQTRVNTGNFYLASTNLQNFFSRTFKLTLPRVVWLGIVAVLVYILMLTNVLTWILEALTYQGVIIVSWVAIAITHIAAHRRLPADSVEFRPGRVPAVNPAGTTAWVVSSLVGIVMVAFGGVTGAVWAPSVSCVLAAGLYAALLRVARSHWLKLDRPYDPREEVDDPWAARIECHRCGDAYIAYEMDRDPSANHQPICLACASDTPGFVRHASAEAASLRGSGRTGSHRQSAGPVPLQTAKRS